MKNWMQCSLCLVTCVFLQTVCSGYDAIASGDVTLYNQGAAQFEISCDDSPHIYVDVIDSTVLEHDASRRDILMVTHAHLDHYDRGFADSFPGKSLIKKVGEFSFRNGKVTSIASTHSESKDDVLLEVDGTNYICLIEINGLRIAHLGDIGQTELSQAQLNKLGAIDIAITQFENPLSQMDMNNKKAFHLMEQLAPKIIIPTSHGRFSEEVVRHAQGIYDVYTSEELQLTFTKNKLPDKTTLLIWGDGASFLNEDLGLKEWIVNN